MLPVDLVGDVGIGVQAEDFGRVVGRQQGHVFQVSGDSARVGRVALRPIDYIKNKYFLHIVDRPCSKGFGASSFDFFSLQNEVLD